MKNRYVEINAAGAIVDHKPLAGNYRLSVGDCLRVVLPSGNTYAQKSPVLKVVEGDGTTRLIAFNLNAMRGGDCDWVPACGGPAALHLECDCWDSGVLIEGPKSTLIVEPRLTMGDNIISPVSLCVCTMISHRLGPTSEWLSKLAVVSREKFNAVHFTPMQPVGLSKSSYSLADQHRICSTLTVDGWKGVDDVLKEMRSQLKLLAFSDVVLNHTASSTQWLCDHPEAAYNVVNSPWLTAAIELDLAIRSFTRAVIAGKWREQYGATSHVRDENDLGCLLRAFRDKCLNTFNLKEYFNLIVDDNEKENFEQRTSSTDMIDENSLYEEALKQVGTSRAGIILPHSIVCKVDPKHRTRVLKSVQERLHQRKDECYRSIVNSVEGTVRFERVEQQRGPVDGSPWNSFVPWYFTPITINSERDDGTEIHLANNGWVMGWDASKDLAAAGSLNYLSRSLVAWSDCVKLRYGNSPEDCPFLWNHMAEYCEKTAAVFDGLRLDNCHSTPLNVGQFMLQRARSVRPNLFVFAELFTGSAETDEVFERLLGIDCLVREAAQTSSPGDLGGRPSLTSSIISAYHVLKFSPKRPGYLEQEVCPKNFQVERFEKLLPQPSRSLLYDCTHDNKTPHELNRCQDALACAAFVCASACAVGSTFGYEILMKTNPSVMADGKLYKVPTAALLEDQGNPSDGHNIRFTARASSVEVWGSFNEWSRGVSLSRDGDQWHTCLKREVYGDGALGRDLQVKFVVDGKWRTSPDYPITKDANGLENNVIRVLNSMAKSVDVNVADGVGLVEARRALNGLHQMLTNQGFHEVSVQWPASDFTVIERHNRKSGHAVFVFIRSAWWKGSDTPEQNMVSIPGRVQERLFAARMDLSRCSWNNTNEVGISEGRSCISPLVREPFCHYEASTDLSHFTFSHFPPGSVYVVMAEVRRPEAQLRRLLDVSMSECFRNISPDSLNYLLWSCEREERDRTHQSRGVYHFPGLKEEVVYAGWAGVMQASNGARQAGQDWLLHPFSKNVTDGPWLLDYHQARLNCSHGSPLVPLYAKAADLIRNTPHKIFIPGAVDILFSSLYQEAVRSILAAVPSPLIEIKDPLLHRLLVASTQVLGSVPSSSLADSHITPTLSAGLPHFTVEYMREWGRDSFLALPGLCLATGRWDMARDEILAYARVIRHGMIPNLLDSSNRPRYNARDAVWFWLYAIQQYVRTAPNGEEILNHQVRLKFPMGLNYEVPAINTISDAIHVVLSCHYKGIAYREWNAGHQIDAHMVDRGFDVNIRCDPTTGFCFGGNRYNCGTWMDKMGSSAKAGNKGVPSSPRDGAPVELTAALWSALNWVVKDLQPRGLFSHLETLDLGGTRGIAYASWLAKLSAAFESSYRVTESHAEKFWDIAVAGSYKDTVGSEKEDEDYFLRCNYGVGLSMAPGLVSKDRAAQALDLAAERLICEANQIGMKTLDPKNYRFKANYDNGNDSHDKEIAHGWNYHQGPEWVWPLGYWLSARYLNGSGNLDRELFICTSKLQSMGSYIQRAPWYSLPELNDSNGTVCRDSCQAQAWSLGSILWFYWTVVSKGSSGGAIGQVLGTEYI